MRKTWIFVVTSIALLLAAVPNYGDTGKREPSVRYLDQGWSPELRQQFYHTPQRLPDWEFALRGGYANQQAQIPDLTFNPGVPSADTHIPSVGLGFHCKENGFFLGLKCGQLGLGTLKPKAFGIDISYQAALYEVRTITVNGTYDTLIHAGGVSLRFIY